MRKAFIASILFHLGVVVVAVVGIPAGEPQPVEIVDTMEVDIADLTVTTKNQKPPREVKETKDEEPPKPPPAPKPRPAAPEPEAEPTPPEPEQADEQPAPPPPPEPKESEVAKPEPEPAPPEPPKEQKVAIVTPVAKPRPKTVKKKDPFESMLNNIKLDDEPVDSPDKKSKQKDFFDTLEDSIETEAKPQPREKTQIATILGTRLTVSEIDAVRRQFEKCWNVPIGARNPEELIVEVKVRVNRDRTVRDAVIVDQARTASDTFFRAMAESARRAVLHRNCSPLRLPPDKYDAWKEMTVVFDPSAMVGR